MCVLIAGCPSIALFRWGKNERVGKEYGGKESGDANLSVSFVEKRDLHPTSLISDSRFLSSLPNERNTTQRNALRLLTSPQSVSL